MKTPNFVVGNSTFLIVSILFSLPETIHGMYEENLKNDLSETPTVFNFRFYENKNVGAILPHESVYGKIQS